MLLLYQSDIIQRALIKTLATYCNSLLYQSRQSLCRDCHNSVSQALSKRLSSCCICAGGYAFSHVQGSQGLQHLLQLCKLGGGHLLCCCRGGQPSCFCSICLACFCKSSSLQWAPKHQAWLCMYHGTLGPTLTVDRSQKCLNMVVQATE